METTIALSEVAGRGRAARTALRPLTPKILLVTTVRWVGTARLAMAFRDAGCQVECVCPSHHPIANLRQRLTVHRYAAWRPISSIGLAILRARPDLLVPCDDRATLAIHRLHAENFGGAHARLVRSTIERSLGAPEHYATLASRTRILEIARELGIRVPATTVVKTERELDRWLRSHGTPAVLKADGTSGGRGVRIIPSQTDCHHVWRLITNPPSVVRAAKWALVNREPHFLLPSLARTRPVANAQAFVPGRDANTLVACWQGRLLACITASVVERSGPYGPASVIELIDHPEMSRSSARIVQRLGLSGLVGFDFILEHNTGDPWLIEVNPRNTQLGHFRVGPGRSLAEALSSCVDAVSVGNRAPNITSNMVALFPQEWLRDPGSSYLLASHHDVPWEEPDLTRACISEDFRVKWWTRVTTFCKALFRIAPPGEPPVLPPISMGLDAGVDTSVVGSIEEWSGVDRANPGIEREPTASRAPCSLPRRTA